RRACRLPSGRWHRCRSPWQQPQCSRSRGASCGNISGSRRGRASRYLKRDTKTPRLEEDIKAGSVFRSHPDPSQWDDYVDFESTSWPRKDRRRYWIIPSVCFNCESACGILAYVDKDTLDIRKIEGNPVHPGSRGRTCAKGVVTPNQLEDPDRILYPMKRDGDRGSGKWRQVSWDEALDDIGGRIRAAVGEKRRHAIQEHDRRAGE